MNRNIYKDWSKNDLIKRIEQLEQEKSTTSEKDDREDAPWFDYLGQWYWDIKKDDITLDTVRIQSLGYIHEKSSKDQVKFDQVLKKVHPEDLNKVKVKMDDIITKKSDIYEVEYRIEASNGNYHWFYDQGRVSKKDSDGNPSEVSGTVFDISNNKKSLNAILERNTKLESLVISDVLTPTYNKRYLTDQIKEAMKLYDKDKNPFSLIMIDIDNFKEINDKHGHLQGDKVLKHIANKILKIIRDDDLLARWGGDEFMILLPKTDISKAERIVKKIKSNFKQVNLPSIKCIDLSIGVLEYSKNMNFNTLIDSVDTLMYKDKFSKTSCKT